MGRSPSWVWEFVSGVCRPSPSTGLVVSLAASALIAAPAPARANVQTARDGRDTAGPLDIELASQAGNGPEDIAARLTTWRPFGRHALSGLNVISFAVYKHRYPFRWIYVRAVGHHLDALVKKDQGDLLGSASVTRPNPRTVVVHIPTGLLGRPAGYRWAAFTAVKNGGVCARWCIDAVPSSLQFAATKTSIVEPRLIDLAAPTVDLGDFPDPSTKRSATLRYPVRFSVSDTGGARIGSWKLQRRRLGTDRWFELQRDSVAGSKRISLRGTEGVTYEHRVVAVDRQGNRRVTRTALVSVPLDDANESLLSTYGGTWSTGAVVAGDFRGTLHTSSDPTASLTFGFDGNHVALIGPGETGVASISVDSTPPVQVDLSTFTGRRRVLFSKDLPAGAHTLSVHLVSGEVGIDGVVVRRGSPTQPSRTDWVPTPTTLGRTTRHSLTHDEGLDCTVPVRDPLCSATGYPQAPISPTYADGWRGWPVRPLHRQHPIGSSFLDPRPSGFHFGIDINVRDDRPERGAPPGRAHRVYAIEGGSVYNLLDSTSTPCRQRRLWVGHFAYYHVDAVVSAGRSVAPGQMIGWTCKGEWHVHLSELTSSHLLINPLHPGGKLVPYADSKRPVIREFAFYKPAPNLWTSPQGAMWSPATGKRVSPDRLRGVVDARVRVSDPQSFRSWLKSLPQLYVDLHPYRVDLALVRLRDRATVVHREISGPVFPYSEPFNNHFAPGSRANQRHSICYHRRHREPVPCGGRFWLHAFGNSSGAYWNTRLFRDGAYRLRITAWDPSGHQASNSVVVRVVNHR